LKPRFKKVYISLSVIPCTEIVVKKKVHYFLFFWALALAGPSAHVHASPLYNGKYSPSPARNTVTPPLIHGLYDYYEVSGDCLGNLKNDLAGKACRMSDGSKYDSITKWRVAWSYGYDKSGGMCSAEGFRLTVDISVKLPAWVHRASAGQPLSEKWESYVDLLKAHENEHVDKVVQAADDITRAVQELPAASTCAELDGEIRQLSKNRMKQLEKDQEGYDAETHHGWTQGALFP
jgi:predicted secreted Zn-dependent protease